MHVLDADPDLGHRASLIVPDALGGLALLRGRALAAPDLCFEVFCDEPSPTLPDLFSGGLGLIASPRLLAALDALGVDNIETFAVDIEDLDGVRMGDGYRALNVVGRVACIDLDRSEANYLDGHLFVLHTMRLKEGFSRELLVFRPHEWNLVVLVHDALADALRATGFTGLRLRHSDAWRNDDF